MRRAPAFIAALALALLWPSQVLASPAPTDTDTTELSMAITALDGDAVRFSGEAIGEALKAQTGYRWVNVLDKGVAIGVVVPEVLTDGIEGYGEWAATGSTVEVVGVYNVACERHGGDLDVHATELSVVRGPLPREHPVNPAKALVAVVMLAVSAVLGVRFRALRRRDS